MIVEAGVYPSGQTPGEYTIGAPLVAIGKIQPSPMSERAAVITDLAPELVEGVGRTCHHEAALWQDAGGVNLVSRGVVTGVAVDPYVVKGKLDPDAGCMDAIGYN